MGRRRPRASPGAGTSAVRVEAYLPTNEQQKLVSLHVTLGAADGPTVPCMESPSDSAEHGHGDAASRDVTRHPAEDRAVGRCSRPSAGSRAGLPGGDGRGAVGGLCPASAVPLPALVRAPKPLSWWDFMWLQVDRAFAEFGGDAARASGGVLAVPRAGRVAAEVAEPILAEGAVGGVLSSVIRAARRAAPGVGVEDGAGLERAPKPPDLWDAMHAQVDRAFGDVLGGDYRNRLRCGSDAGPQDAA